MTIPVYLKSFKDNVPNDGYWDYAFLKALLKRELWNPGCGFEFNITETYPEGQTAGIVVIPARYHFDKIQEINDYLNFHFHAVLLILVGDEDGAFPTEQLKHPNMKVWLMLPHGPKLNVDRYIPNGWPTDTRSILKGKSRKKILDFFFAGQITHKRRFDCLAHLEEMQKKYVGEIHKSPGFTQGLTRERYLSRMAKAKIVPCPSGAVIPDSFRLYEALEAGCLPLVDNKSPNEKGKDYWRLLFGLGELPFPLVDDWNESPLPYHIDTDPVARNKSFAWWQKQKREWTYNAQDDMAELLGMKPEAKNLNDLVTVVIPTSYIDAHPDTSMIEETIVRVRTYLPESEIIITFDGLRDDRVEHKAAYQEYINRMLYLFNWEYSNILPVIFDEYTHQIGMMRKVLETIKTPLVLYAEHDAPLCESIPFVELVNPILEKKVHVIRLHHEALVLDVHKHLMLDNIPRTVSGVPLVRTCQWSQRPHLASVDFYKKLLNVTLKPEAFGMIEDGVLGPVQQAYLERGQPGWNEYRVAIYHPEGDIKRSYHLDGRGANSKNEEDFRY